MRPLRQSRLSSHILDRSAGKTGRLSHPTATPSDAGFLKTVLGASVLITAWLFVVGWTYLRTYYMDFGLNVDLIGFPVYRYFVFSFAQFVTLRGFSLGVGILLVCLFFITWVGVQTTRKWVALLTSCAYLLIYWAGFYMTVRDAKAEAKRDMGLCTSTRPQIIVEIPKSDEIKYYKAAADLKSDNLRLLIDTPDQLYVFVPVNTNANKPTYSVRVLAIDQHEVVATTRIVTLKGKGEIPPCNLP